MPRPVAEYSSTADIILNPLHTQLQSDTIQLTSIRLPVPAMDKSQVFKKILVQSNLFAL